MSPGSVGGDGLGRIGGLRCRHAGQSPKGRPGRRGLALVVLLLPRRAALPQSAPLMIRYNVLFWRSGKPWRRPERRSAQVDRWLPGPSRVAGRRRRPLGGAILLHLAAGWLLLCCVFVEASAAAGAGATGRGGGVCHRRRRSRPARRRRRRLPTALCAPRAGAPAALSDAPMVATFAPPDAVPPEALCRRSAAARAIPATVPAIPPPRSRRDTASRSANWLRSAAYCSRARPAAPKLQAPPAAGPPAAPPREAPSAPAERASAERRRTDRSRLAARARCLARDAQDLSGGGTAQRRARRRRAALHRRTARPRA